MVGQEPADCAAQEDERRKDLPRVFRRITAWNSTSPMAPLGEPPPLYKPELIEPKKRLTLMQRCYKEPWVPIGERQLRSLRVPVRRLTRAAACAAAQAA